MRRTKTKERRKIPRRHIVFYLRVFNADNNKILGHLANLTPRGMMLVSDAPVEKKQKFLLRMKLPKELAGRTEVSFEATCRWCRPDENPDFYISGFKIKSLDRDLESSLLQLVKDFSIEESLKSDDIECPACSLTQTTDS